MKRLLTAAVGVLSVGLFSASAQLSFNFDTDSTEALKITGTWDLQPFEELKVESENWLLSFLGTEEDVEGFTFFTLSVRAQHTHPDGTLGSPFAGTLGYAEITGGEGTIDGVVEDGLASDYYVFKVQFSPPTPMEFELTGLHVVPEPGIFAMLALGLVGFVARRRRA